MLLYTSYQKYHCNSYGTRCFIGNEICFGLQQKIQFLIKRIELISTQSCRSKLAEYLISNQNAENCIIPNCSREVLASRIGISRAALFRELSELQKAKLIEVNSTTIKIINQVGLEHTIYS